MFSRLNLSWMTSSVLLFVFLHHTTTSLAQKDVPPPLDYLPDDLDNDLSYSFGEDLRHLYGNDRFQAEIDGDFDIDNDDKEKDDDEEKKDDEDVAFSVYEFDAEDGEEDGNEISEENEDDAELNEDGARLNEVGAGSNKDDAASNENGAGSNEDGASNDFDDILIHKRNKRFVITHGGGNRKRESGGRSTSKRNHGSGRRNTAPGSGRQVTESRSVGRANSEVDESEGHGHAEGEGRRGGRGNSEVEGHGHAEGAGKRGGRGIKFNWKRVTVNKKPSPKKEISPSRSKDKHSLPDKPIWQIKWPKKAVREAIRENDLFKDEVMKLKMKIGSLTAEQKQEILEQHNKYRGQLPGVSGYPISNIPRAQDMQLMVWDDELEKKAKIHAEKCLFAHDTRKERHLDNLVVGQNIAVDTSPHFFRLAVPKWYGEIALCKWDLSGEAAAKRAGQRCTEYAQLAWSNSSRLGCASVWCPEVTDWDHTGYNLVCNYGPEGHAVRTRPYTPALNDEEICNKCPGRCNNGLCDCGGKVCYNGGSLDVRTCQCSCNPLWGGPRCLEKNCPPTDPEECGLPYPKGYPKSYCKQFPEIRNQCPYMCGVCTGARCAGKKCINAGVLDLKTCKCKCKKIFAGDTCNKLSCPEKDSWFCGTTWDKSYCRRIITAQFECPYMCNICKKKS